VERYLESKGIFLEFFEYRYEDIRDLAQQCAPRNRYTYPEPDAPNTIDRAANGEDNESPSLDQSLAPIALLESPLITSSNEIQTATGFYPTHPSVIPRSNSGCPDACSTDLAGGISENGESSGKLDDVANEEPIASRWDSPPSQTPPRRIRQFLSLPRFLPSPSTSDLGYFSDGLPSRSPSRGPQSPGPIMELDRFDSRSTQNKDNVQENESCADRDSHE
jgi:hypothetical protein